MVLSEKVLYFCTDVGHYHPIKGWRPVGHSPVVAVHRAAEDGGEAGRRREYIRSLRGPTLADVPIRPMPPRKHGAEQDLRMRKADARGGDNVDSGTTTSRSISALVMRLEHDDS